MQASDDQIISITNGTIRTNFATLYKTEVVPEFPIPLAIAVASLVALITFSRVRSKLWEDKIR